MIQGSHCSGCIWLCSGSPYPLTLSQECRVLMNAVSVAETTHHPAWPSGFILLLSNGRRRTLRPAQSSLESRCIIHSQSWWCGPSMSICESDDQLLQVIYPETILKEQKKSFEQTSICRSFLLVFTSSLCLFFLPVMGERCFFNLIFSLT